MDYPILDLNYTVSNSGEAVKGLVYVSEVSFKPRRNEPDKVYVNGTFRNKGKTFAFRCFDDAIVKCFKENNLVNCVMYINGNVDEFKGYVSIIVKGLSVINDVDASVFMDSHNIDDIFNSFNEYLQKTFSVEELGVINKIFCEPTDGFQRFKVEFAGKMWHDACRGGLMYHTLKMIKLCDFMFANDYRMTALKSKIPNLEKLVKLGIVLHDLGKVIEMQDGVYTEKSIISHRVRAVEYLARNKEAVVGLYGDDGYDWLLSEVAQHHGVFEGDKPTTIYAYLVHIIDIFDAQATHVMEGVLSDNNADGDGRHYVYADEMKLYY